MAWLAWILLTIEKYTSRLKHLPPRASVCGITVSIAAFQAVDPGSTPGKRTSGWFSFFFLPLIIFVFFISLIATWYNWLKFLLQVKSIVSLVSVCVCAFLPHTPAATFACESAPLLVAKRPRVQRLILILSFFLSLFLWHQLIGILQFIIISLFSQHDCIHEGTSIATIYGFLFK